MSAMYTDRITPVSSPSLTHCTSPPSPSASSPSSPPFPHVLLHLPPVSHFSISSTAPPCLLSFFTLLDLTPIPSPPSSPLWCRHISSPPSHTSFHPFLPVYQTSGFISVTMNIQNL
ncbi:hypothetical protein GDO81_022644 [Engystomops pustulosus]|uniref:Uncharacterized protein n=1 Tax=Engystomops pustulosus TaxID=76066 RepID=A0AAV6ZJ70_ENGPU|nr:hypothetical protein GDO81_022644 [Engystomops pustulosus]